MQSDMDDLIRIYKKLLRETKTSFVRYLYHDIDWNDRIIGIRGPRGVGKTTLMLQRIKLGLSADDALYVNADDIFFSSHTLLWLAEKLVQRGVHYLFIDEIHKYPDWSRELKLIYDYYSELKVVFSGSSVLDINKGTSDLSRRAVLYYLYGLSFREYLGLFQGISVREFTLNEIVSGGPEELTLKTPIVFFDEYLRHGYYPYGGDGSFNGKLRQIIGLSLEVDIPVFADLPSSMGHKFKKLLSIIARSVPFKPNMSKLSELIGVSRNNMSEYFKLIEDAGLIAQLSDDTGGIRGLGKIEKVYIDNTNLIYSLAQDNANVGNLRETFFYNQMRVRNLVTSSRISDFSIEGRTFEIGGKSKGKKQIASASEGYVVKDDIELSAGNILPMWWFGLNY